MSEPSYAELRARKVLSEYGDSIFRLAFTFVHNEQDAQEVVQDTLIQMLRYDPSFDTEKQEKGWLLKTAANLSRNKLKFNKVRETDELDERLKAEEKPDLAFVWDAVKTLPRDYQSAIYLFHKEGYSTKEIAEILKKRESSVRSDLARARKQLKLILKEDYDFEE